MTQSEPLREVIAARPGLRRKTWGPDTVVFNPLSGELHLLNAVADFALRALEEGPCALATLTTRTAEAFAVANDQAFRSQMERLASDLDELGLLEPAPPPRS